MPLRQQNRLYGCLISCSALQTHDRAYILAHTIAPRESAMILKIAGYDKASERKLVQEMGLPPGKSDTLLRLDRGFSLESETTLSLMAR